LTTFAKAVQPGDVIVAGRNFGCGSSREQPVVGLKAVGVAAIVAKGFARIFYRAAINQGLLLIECPDAVDAYQPGSTIQIDAVGGQITVDGRAFAFPKLPPEIMAICEAGGLLEYTRTRLRTRKTA
jgi:3-isopropylmalate/(R)-2-methylmalate dehydratase small subunit